MVASVPLDRGTTRKGTQLDETPSCGDHLFIQFRCLDSGNLETGRKSVLRQ